MININTQSPPTKRIPCRITAKSSASRRTKNRIKEKGPLFFFIEERDVSCFNGEKASLFVNGTNWSSANLWEGWFPNNEIEVEIVDYNYDLHEFVDEHGVVIRK